MKNNLNVFIGTQTEPRERNAAVGIAVHTFSALTATLSADPIAVYRDIKNPTFLIRAHHKNWIYAVSETHDFEGINTGGVFAFKFDEALAHPKNATHHTQPGSALQRLNVRSSGGIDPCHLSIDHTDRVLFVSNYTSGHLAVFKLGPEGHIADCTQLIHYAGASVHPNQQSSHIHCAAISLDNRYVYVTDLGTDHIYCYALNVPRAILTEAQPAFSLKPGAGPRHFIFHPHLNVAYVVNELDCTVVVFDQNVLTGQLTQKQAISVAESQADEVSGADIHITQNAKFLYVSIRGENKCTVLKVDGKTGILKRIQSHVTMGKHPRNFMLTADDRFLLCAHRDTHNVMIYEIDQNTGGLTYKSQHPIHRPMCVIA